MSGPSDGRYRIQLAVYPNLFIGVDPGPVSIKPVITAGSVNVWTVLRKEDGNYTLTLEDSGRPLSILDNAGYLYGSDRPPPSPCLWSIRGQDDGLYMIEVPSATICWTVNNPAASNFHVTINPTKVPLPNQQWNFIPWQGP